VPVEPIYNERELLVQLAEGDEYAFRQLYLAYFDGIYSAALAYTKVHEQAEDITQQVFLKIWEKRDSLIKVDKLESYLFIIARNAIFSQFAKLATQQKHLHHIRELFEEESGNPEVSLIHKQERALLERAVKQLSPRQQQAYRLSREKGFSYEEIAQAMNITKPTVREHMVNSMQSIREFLLVHRNQLISLLLFFLQK
jgi:RNA polymerase sigma-70 factor (ECF subfamily)